MLSKEAEYFIELGIAVSFVSDYGRIYIVETSIEVRFLLRRKSSDDHLLLLRW